MRDRIAIVTGSTAGIGEAVARALASAGARVVVNGRRADRAEALARELAGTGEAGAGGGGEGGLGEGQQRVRAVAGDCADDAVIARLIAAARAWGRAPDLVVVNAGRGLKGGAIDSDAGQWEEMIRTNLLAAARLLRASSRAMLEDVGGEAGVLGRPRDIIVIGSVVGRHVSPFSAMYGSTKFAVHGLTEATRRELAPKGIRVTLVEPGFVVSEFQGVAGYADEWFRQVMEKIGPPLTPGDVARVVGFIASQPAGVHVSDVMIRPTRQDYP